MAGQVSGVLMIRIGAVLLLSGLLGLDLDGSAWTADAAEI